MKIGKLREGTPVIAASSRTQMALLVSYRRQVQLWGVQSTVHVQQITQSREQNSGPVLDDTVPVVKLRSWLEMPTKALTFSTNFDQIVRHLLRFYT